MKILCLYGLWHDNRSLSIIFVEHDESNHSQKDVLQRIALYNFFYEFGLSEILQNSNDVAFNLRYHKSNKFSNQTILEKKATQKFIHK